MLRLPQSIATSLSTRFSSSRRVASLALLAVFVTLFPLGAQAASEQLTCTPTSLNFGNVTVHHTETQLVVLKNTGQRTVTVLALKVSGSEFGISHLPMPFRLAAGRSVTLNVRFTPTATGSAGGGLTFTSNAANSTLRLSLAGAGVTSEAVKASPASVSFGRVAMGSSSKLPLVLTNEHSSKIQLLAFSASTKGGGFSISGPSLPLVLKPGQSVKFVVKFAPQTTGLVGESVLVEGPDIEIPIEGFGTQASAPGQLQISPEPLNFGKVPVGTTDTQLIALSATGTSVTVTSASSSSAQFVLEGASFPLTIAAGHNVSLQVAFTPKSSGTISGTLTVVSNAANSATQESVSGIGTVMPYSVSLSWNPSTSAVVGYNVYRGPGTSGPWGKLNSALDANTAYQDSSVVSGNTYYYAATAVDSSGKESALSTPVEVVVP